jgi:4-nitrophenyl phosphatase
MIVEYLKRNELNVANMMNFSAIDGLIMDMDGVLWRGDVPLPGMTELFAFLRARAIPFALATNNSSKSQLDYVNKLAGLGVTGIEERQIVTSGTATVDYLLSHYPAGTAVHVLGGDGLKRMIAAAGFPLSDQAGVVVAGIDTGLTYDKLKRAAYLIQAGADFIGTNDDVTFPMPDGLAPGAGSILAALQAATGRTPLVMGKPGAAMFEAALRVIGVAADRALMLGDRLNTDIIGAQRAGLKAALVLTGVSTRAEAEQAAPDAIYNDLHEFLDAWSRT